MVGQIIPVHPIKHHRIGGEGERRQQTMEFPLAGIAAILGIAGVGRILQLGGGYFLVPQS